MALNLRCSLAYNFLLLRQQAKHVGTKIKISNFFLDKLPLFLKNRNTLKESKLYNILNTTYTKTICFLYNSEKVLTDDKYLPLWDEYLGTFVYIPTKLCVPCCCTFLVLR